MSVTDEFEQVADAGPWIGTQQARGEREIHRSREGARVLDRGVVADLAVVEAGVPLDHMQLLGVRRAAAIEPPFVVEANGIDDERVALEPAD